MIVDDFRTEAFCLLSVGIFVVLTRFIVRVLCVGWKKLWADDYLILFATIIYAFETTAAYMIGARYHGLANNGMTDAERASLSPLSLEYRMRVKGSKLQLVGWSLYTLLLWTLKLCVCIFYQRLTNGLPDLRPRVFAGYAVIACTYIAVELSILLGCQPFSANWQISPDPGNYCQPAVSLIDLYVTLILNILSDAYLLAIPLPLLLRMGISWRTKVSLVGLFSGALFVMAAGCVRCALIIQDPVGGAQAAGYWAVRETFVAVIVTNVPILYGGYRTLYRFGLTWSSASRDLMKRTPPVSDPSSSALIDSEAPMELHPR